MPQCEINKVEITYKRLKESDLLLLGGPRDAFTGQELQDIRRFIDEGGKCLIMLGEGGEHKHETNINAMLEQVGLSFNNDAVIRKTYY